MKSKLLFALLAFAPILVFGQTYQPYQNPHVQFFAGSAGPLSAGAPAAGYKLCTYAAGTTTPQATYSNNSGSLNTNPVVLDSSGYGTIYLNGALSYKFTLLSAGTDSTCATGTQQWSQDQITGLNVGGLTLAGNLIWTVDNSYDIGASGASRPRDFYLGRNAFIGGNLIWSTDNSFDLGASGANRPRDFYLGRNFKLGGSVTSNLTFSTDNTLDIGASGATRPRDFFLGRNAVIGGTTSFGGNVTFATDNTNDLGASAANRPRDFYLGRNAFFGGNLTWPTDNSFDIGASGATRPRDLWLGRDLRVNRDAYITGNFNLAGWMTSTLKFTPNATYDIGASAAAPNNLILAGYSNQGGIFLAPTMFVNLGNIFGSVVDGEIQYCSNCTIANPCAGGGTGAIAKRLNGVWVCN